MMGSNGGGFNFDLCKRNAVLEQKGVKPPGFTKTGTTIVGLVYKVRVARCTISSSNPLTTYAPYSLASWFHGDGSA